MTSAWRMLLAASALARELDRVERPRRFAWTGTSLVTVDGSDATASLEWRPRAGWQRLSGDQLDSPLIDLYLPICSATARRPLTVGHLGQSLDGFIATSTGDSQFVTGDENILHLHRMRALCDAIVVGAGTVAADDPLLTTRLVEGAHPLRVVLDPTRRLQAADYQIFNDATAPTICLTEPSVVDVLHILRERGCSRIFVEGGGVTVSAFLEADLLDRLQLAIAPLLIGEGRPAIRLLSRANLRDCRRPRCRVFRMGGDVLFDCELNPTEPEPKAAAPSVSRII